MAVIGKCQYTKDGRLVRPRELDVRDAKLSMGLDIGGKSGDRFTTERGCTHVYLVEAAGLSPAQAKQRSKDKLQTFFDHADFINGFRKISMERRTDYTPINQNYTITYEIVYAIEEPYRSSRSVSPYEGQSRE